MPRRVLQSGPGPRQPPQSDTPAPLVIFTALAANCAENQTLSLQPPALPVVEQ